MVSASTIIRAMKIGDRIRKARTEVAKITQEALGKHFGISPKAVAQWESGTTVPRGPKLQELPRLLGVSSRWLMEGRGPMTIKAEGDHNSAEVAVVGYIGAGDTVYPIDDFPKGRGMDSVEAPPEVDPDEVVAVRVRGNSMYPQLEDGWTVFYKRDQDGVPAECKNRLCVVKLDDDRMLVKRLRWTTRKGRYNLESFNSPTLEDVKVVWAARVLAIKTN